MQGSLLYVLEVEAEGLSVSLRLNEVEVFADRSGAQRTFATKLNPWVVQGKNDLEVWLGPVLDAEGKPLGGTRAFRLTVVRGFHGADPGPAGRILTWQFDPERDALDYEVVLPMWNASFEEPLGFGRWAWQDAPPAPCYPQDEEAIRARVVELHAALARRDVDAVTRLLAVKHAELARALDVPAEEIAEGQGDTLRDLFGEADWSMEPIDPAALEIHAWGGERLFAVTDRGGPPLRGRGGERPYLQGLVFSRVGGEWAIVR